MASRVRVPVMMGVPLIPARRVAAIDAGSQTVKLLLAEELFGRLRVLHHEIVDLQEEGLLGPEETGRHMQELLRKLGQPPVALVLSQQKSLSQVVDLPDATGNRVRRQLEEEIVKLSGLSDTKMAYDYAPLEPIGKFKNPFWVSLCQESEIWTQVGRLGIPEDEVCEVTNSANALVAALRETAPEVDRAVLADIGRTQTVLVVVAGGQAVHSSAFPVGTGSGAGDPGRPLDWVPAWFKEFSRVLKEWLRESGEPAATLESMEVLLAGGGSHATGLVDALGELASLRFRLWPSTDFLGDPAVESQFLAAYGAALQALGRSPQPVSLLPSELHAVWQKRRALQTLHSCCAVALSGILLLLAIGTWQKLRLLDRKQTLLTAGQAALDKMNRAENLADLSLGQYETVRPVLQRQLETLDTLRALAALQQARSNQNLWFVLFADQESYFTLPSLPTTNAPAPVPTPPREGTNAPAYKYGFVAELCVPLDPEPMRRALSALVAELKKDGGFRNVDALPADLRRPFMVDAKLLLADRSAALDLELPVNEFRTPVKASDRRAPVTNGGTGSGRVPARSSFRSGERGASAPDSPGP